MIGIKSYGAYIPLYRLSRGEISNAWGGSPDLKGEKAIANYDEDSTTMAVAACIDCTKDINRKNIDSFYFGSTSFPYREKQSSAIVAKALDLNATTFTLDISNSLRCGTSAVRIAMDALRAKVASNVLVSASDIRLGLPNGANEMDFGDGAAALLLSDTDVIASIDGEYHCTDEILDVWRSSDDRFVHTWEDRFVKEKGYARVLSEAVKAAFKEFSLAPKDFSKAVLYSPNFRSLTPLAVSLGFNAKTQVQDPLYNTIGNTGSALSLMMLVAALEEAKPGDRLIWVGYGDGCNIYIINVTENITKLGARRGIKKHLASKKPLSSYQKYLRWRDIIATEPPARPPLNNPSAVALWRDSKGGLALYGVKCKRCGTPQYPAQRVCMVCRAKDEFEDYYFADKTGTLTTFSQDNLAASIDPPSTISVVDFMGGGRIMCDMTDRDPEQVQVGMRVEMTFRKIRSVMSSHTYWWKFQPVRC